MRLLVDECADVMMREKMKYIVWKWAVKKNCRWALEALNDKKLIDFCDQFCASCCIAVLY